MWAMEAFGVEIEDARLKICELRFKQSALAGIGRLL